ncbi:MAG: hypothetical protein ACUVWK_01385 [Nitrososphaerales archaeon]
MWDTCKSNCSTPEKYEKKYEKGEKSEKREKHEKREKAPEWFGPLVGGSILILVGFVFYLYQAGIIELRFLGAYILLGIGLILILVAIIRYASSK